MTEFIKELDSDEAGGSQTIEVTLEWNDSDYKYIQYNTFPKGHEGLTSTITAACDDLYPGVNEDWDFVAVFYLDEDEAGAPHSTTKVEDLTDYYSLDPFPTAENGCYVVCNVDGTHIHGKRKTKGKVSNQGGGGNN